MSCRDGRTRKRDLRRSWMAMVVSRFAEGCEEDLRLRELSQCDGAESVDLASGLLVQLDEQRCVVNVMMMTKTRRGDEKKRRER